MRYMHDSVTASHIPASATMVAGYVNGTFQWSAADWARFPHAVKVRIATRASVNDGHVLDVEPGCATPAQAVDWLRRRRAAGVDPSIYCSELSLQDTSYSLASCRAVFSRAGLAQPHYWVARYNGDKTIPSGCVAKQYLWDNSPHYSGGHYDFSSVADYWPGIDAPKTTTKPVTPAIRKPKHKEDSMVLIYRDSKGVEHVAIQNGGTMIGLSAGPARNAHIRAVTNGELDWMAVTVTEWNAAWANHNKLIGA